MIKKQYLKSKPLCKVTFTLPKEAAAEAKEVRVLGEFNEWNWENGVPMKASKNEPNGKIPSLRLQPPPASPERTQDQTHIRRRGCASGLEPRIP